MTRDSEILGEASAAARRCYRLTLEKVDASTMREQSAVEGTWLGGALYCEPQAPNCPICCKPLSAFSQIDTTDLGGSIWSLYLCDRCLSTNTLSEPQAYVLTHYSTPQSLQACSPVEDTTSSLVDGAWRLCGQLGSSFPSVEEFFRECPTVEEEHSYAKAVATLDPEAELSDEGCFFGETRYFQIGGYAELLNNMGGNRNCSVCNQGMSLVLAAPNTPPIFPSWPANYVLAVWACPTHSNESSMTLSCVKSG